MAVPSPVVLTEFEVQVEPSPLPGGQGKAWRAGDVVLKPLDMSAVALEWQADVLASLCCDGFRVAAPLRSRAGALSVEGWIALPWLPGRHEPRWADILAVGARFHDALADVERPGFVLDVRSDVWARADRIAWGELPVGDLAEVPEVAYLLSVRGVVSAPAQLVHGDLSGNVLFADGLPPAVIDFSPYWRPQGYASAIVAVDAVAWHGADSGLLSIVAKGRDGGELLIRALLFRLLSDRDPAGQAGAYRRAVDYVRRTSPR